MDPHNITQSNEAISSAISTPASARANALPKDFLSFEDAIALIQSDTRKDPKVDIQSLVNAFPYMMPRANCGFTIRLLKRDESGRIVQDGIRYVSLDSEYKCTTFQHVVSQKYEELARQAIVPTIKRASSVVNDSDNPGGYLRTEHTGINIGDDI